VIGIVFGIGNMVTLVGALVAAKAAGRFGVGRTIVGNHNFETKTSRSRPRFFATLPRMRTVSTPWGKAEAVEQVSVAQRAGERRFATIVELLETADGERLVRFAYTTGGSVRRGPVTLRAKDVERMQNLLERTPELREALRKEGR
jgi:hypothetical protein